jgi:hypothetical protein
MMTQKQQTDIRILQALFTDIRFESIFNAMDRLHDAAACGKLAEITNLSQDEVIAWLKEIAFTAQETIRELEVTSKTSKWDTLLAATQVDFDGEDWLMPN